MTPAEFIQLCAEIRSAGVERFQFRGYSATFSKEPLRAVRETDERPHKPTEKELEALYDETMYHSS